MTFFLLILLLIYLKVSAILFAYIAGISFPNYRTLIDISKQLDNPVSHFFKVSQLIPCIVVSKPFYDYIFQAL